MFQNRIRITAIFITIVFLLDLVIPLGVAIGVLYIACLVLLIKESPTIIVQFSIVVSTLTIFVPIITTTSETTWMAYINRGISVISIVIVCIISLRYQKLDKLREAYILLLEKRNKEQEQFVYIASHDLQEPLRTVSNYARLLKNKYGESLDERAKKWSNPLLIGQNATD